MAVTEKVRIKNEEQIRIKKRKRPDSTATLKKKAKLSELTDKQESVKKQGKDYCFSTAHISHIVCYL